MIFIKYSRITVIYTINIDLELNELNILIYVYYIIWTKHNKVYIIS